MERCLWGRSDQTGFAGLLSVSFVCGFVLAFRYTTLFYAGFYKAAQFGWVCWTFLFPAGGFLLDIFGVATDGKAGT